MRSVGAACTYDASAGSRRQWACPGVSRACTSTEPAIVQQQTRNGSGQIDSGEPECRARARAISDLSARMYSSCQWTSRRCHCLGANCERSCQMHSPTNGLEYVKTAWQVSIFSRTSAPRQLCFAAPRRHMLMLFKTHTGLARDVIRESESNQEQM